MSRSPESSRPMLLHTAPVLITGGAGFIGSNLADRLAGEGHDVLIFDALLRPGVAANLAWLKRRHPQRISSVVADIRDRDAVADAVAGAKAVFHFAAQVAVTTSLVDPHLDFETNVQGTIFLLESLRRRRRAVPLVFASTNKVYGALDDIELVQEGDAWLPRDPHLRAHGIDERRPLSFCTPYGCSKGAADQYVLEYARNLGVPAALLRMSCIYGQRQLGTEDQGWVAHFLRQALAGAPITIYGDGRQVRDVLHVDDAVDAYVTVWRGFPGVAGSAFNLGGGPPNAVSLLQLIGEIEWLLGRRVDRRFESWRPGDQRYFATDARRIATRLGLRRPRNWRRGVADLARWLRREPSAVAPAAAEAVG